eukprot:1184526-Prymnesium_polylepis.2
MAMSPPTFSSSTFSIRSLAWPRWRRSRASSSFCAKRARQSSLQTTARTERPRATQRAKVRPGHYTVQLLRVPGRCSKRAPPVEQEPEPGCAQWNGIGR